MIKKCDKKRFRKLKVMYWEELENSDDGAKLF